MRITAKGLYLAAMAAGCAVIIWSWWTYEDGTPANQARRLAQLHAAPIADSWLEADSGYESIGVALVDGATDLDAREVWCSILPAARVDPDIAYVIDEAGEREWPAPGDCSDSPDVPEPLPS